MLINGKKEFILYYIITIIILIYESPNSEKNKILTKKNFPEKNKFIKIFCFHYFSDGGLTLAKLLGLTSAEGANFVRVHGVGHQGGIGARHINPLTSGPLSPWSQAPDSLALICK